MLKIILPGILGMGIVAAAFAVPALVSAQEQPKIPMSQDLSKLPAGSYAIQGGHTQVVWSIIHQKLSPYYGRIDKASGTLVLDPKNLANSKLNVSVNMADLNTPFVQGTRRVLDERICAEEAFACEKFPTATFVSKSIKVTGKNTGDITGDLTLHGVTAPLTLHATLVNAGTSEFGNRPIMGLDVRGTIKRSDHGLTKLVWMGRDWGGPDSVSDEVQLYIEAEIALGGDPPPPANLSAPPPAAP